MGLPRHVTLQLVRQQDDPSELLLAPVGRKDVLVEPARTVRHVHQTRFLAVLWKRVSTVLDKGQRFSPGARGRREGQATKRTVFSEMTETPYDASRGISRAVKAGSNALISLICEATNRVSGLPDYESPRGLLHAPRSGRPGRASAAAEAGLCATGRQTRARSRLYWTV